MKAQYRTLRKLRFYRKKRKALERALSIYIGKTGKHIGESVIYYAHNSYRRLSIGMRERSLCREIAHSSGVGAERCSESRRAFVATGVACVAVAAVGSIAAYDYFAADDPHPPAPAPPAPQHKKDNIPGPLVMTAVSWDEVESAYRRLCKRVKQNGAILYKEAIAPDRDIVILLAGSGRYCRANRMLKDSRKHILELHEAMNIFTHRGTVSSLTIETLYLDAKKRCRVA